MKNGIVYIVFRNKSTEEFTTSIKLLKQTYPNIHVTLFTDKIENQYVDNRIIIEPRGKRIKQYHLEDSPYENTLYLDATSGVVGPIHEIFRLLERFDIACVQDLIRKHDVKSAKYPDYAKIPDGFPEYSGGIILFKKSKPVINFFKLWRENFQRWYELTGEDRDQPSLRVSLWQCDDLKIHTLPPEYSIRDKKYHNISPRIFHIHKLGEKRLKKSLFEWHSKNPGKI
jgi:hypothetical protein